MTEELAARACSLMGKRPDVSERLFVVGVRLAEIASGAYACSPQGSNVGQVQQYARLHEDRRPRAQRIAKLDQPASRSKRAGRATTSSARTSSSMGSVTPVRLAPWSTGREAWKVAGRPRPHWIEALQRRETSNGRNSVPIKVGEVEKDLLLLHLKRRRRAHAGGTSPRHFELT